MAGRRAGDRFDAQHHVTTEALLFLGELDPEAIGPSLEFATHYEPTPVAQAEALLDASPLDPRCTTFVDIGAGMGRVVFLAARRPFRAIVGVEISPALVEVARDNLATLVDPLRVASDVCFVDDDAATYVFPAGDLCVYLYNPFGAPILAAMIQRLCNAADARDIVLLYHTALQHDVIAASGMFDVIADLGFGLVYRRRRGA